MNSLKRLFIFGLCVLMSLSFSSCGDDDDDDEIVGGNPFVSFTLTKITSTKVRVAATVHNIDPMLMKSIRCIIYHDHDPLGGGQIADGYKTSGSAEFTVKQTGSREGKKVTVTANTVLGQSIKSERTIYY
ncbi:MAG: hypothetical protein IJ816_02360 [Alloprevotella sp.]|nr:hypothetical protein [Alloprevotella sp.]